MQNATKFTNSGTILIKVCYIGHPTNQLVVHVDDSGIGIKNQDLHKLFTRFGKLQRSADMNSDGLGLGLYLAKKIIESSNGKIAANSKGIG